jgi:hypothetical protein
MIYINKFGMLNIVDEEEGYYDEITEQTIQIADEWNSTT